MAEVRRTGKKILLFVLLVSLVAAGIVEPYFQNEVYHYQDGGVRDSLAGSLDELVCGSSHAYRGIVPEVLDEIAPMDKDYHHDDTWHDGNGYAHIRAAMFGSSITVPLIEGALLLGTWQQIVLIDFDNKSRARNIYVQIIC